MVEKLTAEGFDPSEFPDIFPPTYVAKNIKDFKNSRDRIIVDAIDDYRNKRSRAENIPGMRGLVNRNLIKNPTQTTSVFGKFKYEYTSTSAFVAIPTVRHNPERDNRKHRNKLTISDVSDECEIQLPDAIWSRVLPHLGLRALPADVLKMQTWASDVLLFCNYQTRNGKPDDNYYLIHAANKNLRGGKMIPTLMAELRAAGLVFNPQAN